MEHNVVAGSTTKHLSVAHWTAARVSFGTSSGHMSEPAVAVASVDGDGDVEQTISVAVAMHAAQYAHSTCGLASNCLVMGAKLSVHPRRNDV